MRILALSGKKQSGKNTACNFIHAIEMISLGLVDHAGIDEKGQLIIPVDIEGKINEMVYDISANYQHHAQWCAENLWPYIKQYSFADSLKMNVCMGVLGLTYEQCYGTDEEKNSYTNLRWEDMPGMLTPYHVKALYPGREWGSAYNEVKAAGLRCHVRGYMTAREVMQFVGTEIFRRMYGDVWADATIRQIKAEGSQFAIITDCRFPNEVQVVQDAGGKVIRLTRYIDAADEHKSEKALDREFFDWNRFDAIMDNMDANIREQCVMTTNLLTEWGWLDERTQEAVNDVKVRQYQTTAKKES